MFRSYAAAPIWLVFFLPLSVCSMSVSAAADVDRAMSEIMGERLFEKNALRICQVAATKNEHERFDFLADYVLPGAHHSHFRLAIDFTQTDPTPLMDRPQAARATQLHRRIHIGGEIVSPAFDLISTASRLARLPELRDRIDRLSPTTVADRNARTAVLVATELQMGESQSAMMKFRILLATVANIKSIDAEQEPALLFAMSSLQRHRETHVEAAEELPAIVKRVRVAQADNLATLHLRAAINRIIASAVESETSTITESRQWHPVNRWNAQSRGTGVPPSVWKVDGSRVENVVSHSHDLMYFAIPLRNRFDVDCDATVFSGRDVELLVAGRWYAPSYTLDKYSTGDIRGNRRYIKLHSKMSKATGWMRLQSSVRDSEVHNYFNGRRIDAVDVPENHDPWIAIHSERRYEGSARNIHISGSPVIPDYLELIADESLSGWLPYFGSSIGSGDAQWRHSYDDENPRLIGIRSPSTRGSHHEEAIHYHRPMLEDGSVDIEFFYREGEMNVHPMIDRLCFLLQPNGVKIHWLTDGAYDRTGLHPDNVVDEPENRRGPATLPLKNDAWNKLQLALTNDTVQLYLNSQLIYERTLERTNQRSFGLFHYADHSEARVRSIVYRGKWPRKLPAIAEQELADPEQLELEEHLASLPVSFLHDFSKGLPSEKFTVTGDDAEQFVLPKSDGVHVTRPGIDDDNWYDFIVSPDCVVHGDFDITARFSHFRANYKPGGYGSASIRLSFDDEYSSWCTWLLRTERLKSNLEDGFLQLMMSRRREGKTFHEYFRAGSAEYSAGRLRVARRDETLYFMTAEENSPYFRVMKKMPVSRDPTLTSGIRLLASSHEVGETKVTWKDIRIRAEKITGVAVREAGFTLEQLNAQRQKLSPLMSTAFTDKDEAVRLFAMTTDEDRFTWTDNGLQVFAPGTDDWTSCRLFSRASAEGDFDVEFEFEILNMPPCGVEEESTVYLAASFTGPGRPEVQCKCAINSDGSRTAETLNRLRRKDGSYEYREHVVQDAPVMTGLRIARRGDMAYMIIRRGEDDAWEILDRLIVGSGRILPNGIQFHVHAGGDGKETEVLLKKMQIRASPPAPNGLNFLRGLLN